MGPLFFRSEMLIFPSCYKITLVPKFPRSKTQPSTSKPSPLTFKACSIFSRLFFIEALKVLSWKLRGGIFIILGGNFVCVDFRRENIKKWGGSKRSIGNQRKQEVSICIFHSNLCSKRFYPMIGRKHFLIKKKERKGVSKVRFFIPFNEVIPGFLFSLQVFLEIFFQTNSNLKQSFFHKRAFFPL